MTDLTKNQIATLTAIITGGEPRGAANREKAAARFIKVAKDAGIGEPEITLESDFETAAEYLRGFVTRFPDRAAAAANGAGVEEESDENSDRPGDAFEAEQAMLEEAEGSTRPRLRAPVVVDHSASNALIAGAIAADPELARMATAFAPEAAKVIVGIKLASERFGTYYITLNGEVGEGSPALPETNAIELARQMVVDQPDSRVLHEALEPEAPAPKKPAAAPKAPKADDADKPWFRQADAVDALMYATMKAAGPSKLAVFRKAIIEAKPDFAELTQTQQNGVLIRSIDRMMDAGRLTRDGLIYGVKAEEAAAA